MPSPRNIRLSENRTAAIQTIDRRPDDGKVLDRGVHRAFVAIPGECRRGSGSPTQALVHLCRSAGGLQQCGRLPCADGYGYLREARSWRGIPAHTGPRAGLFAAGATCRAVAAAWSADPGGHSPVALQGQARRCLIPASVLLMLAGTARRCPSCSADRRGLRVGRAGSTLFRLYRGHRHGPRCPDHFWFRGPFRHPGDGR